MSLNKIIMFCVAALSGEASARVSANEGGIDTMINQFVSPISTWLSQVVFYKVELLGTQITLVVVWLVIGGVFFSFYLGFINITGFWHAVKLVRGDFISPRKEVGELSHFQALTAAVSGTVGIGNIGGVAVAISIGGPGATFWMIVAGFLGMSTKFMECVLGTKFRNENPDGSVSGGPMYYLEKGLALKGMPTFGKAIGVFYAIGIVIACFGIGNMFQSNQAYMQFVNITGGTRDSWLADKGWLFGIFIAVLVGVVIVGGIKNIAKVTEKVVPVMAVLYCGSALIIIGMNYEAIPFAVNAIIDGAFNSQGMAGGVVGVMLIGFQRAVFSNEAGIGSAAIAHAAVKTNEPVTEGYVALLEPFIDTIVICTITALVIITTFYYDPSFHQGLDGIVMTSAAFERNVSWSPYAIAIAGFLFAFSTLIAWSYYGLKAWTYLVGESKLAELSFKLLFCAFAAIGCTIQLSAVLDISDAFVFVICVPNILGLYILAPIVKGELTSYKARLTAGEFVDYSKKTLYLSIKGKH